MANQAGLFWDELRRVADLAAAERRDELYECVLTLGRTAVSEGMSLPPTDPPLTFVTCPVCQARPGQRCVSVPGHPLGDPEDTHPERTERGMKLHEEVEEQRAAWPRRIS